MVGSYITNGSKIIITYIHDGWMDKSFIHYLALLIDSDRLSCLCTVGRVMAVSQYQKCIFGKS